MTTRRRPTSFLESATKGMADAIRERLERDIDRLMRSSRPPQRQTQYTESAASREARATREVVELAQHGVQNVAVDGISARILEDAEGSKTVQVRRIDQPIAVYGIDWSFEPGVETPFPEVTVHNPPRKKRARKIPVVAVQTRALKLPEE